jgi:hypothetical protein
MRLAIPRRLDAYSCSRLLQTLHARQREPLLTIDFTNVRFVLPFGTIALLTTLISMLDERSEAGRRTQFLMDKSNSAGCSYLANFRFFELLNLTIPATPIALSTNRYMVITKLDRADVSFEGVPIQEKLDQVCIHLGMMLLNSLDRYCAGVLAVAWALREAIRNVFEHGGVDEAYVMAQRWSDGTTEFALGDLGVGVLFGLEEPFNIHSGVDALRLATLPGITEYQGPETRNRWQNSGFGLYMLSEVARAFGRLHLASDGALLTADAQGTRAASAGFHVGTAVGLRMRVPDDVYWPNFLQQAKLRGEEEAGRIPGARRIASASTTALW